MLVVQVLLSWPVHASLFISAVRTGVDMFTNRPVQAIHQIRPVQPGILYPFSQQPHATPYIDHQAPRFPNSLA